MARREYFFVGRNAIKLLVSELRLCRGKLLSVQIFFLFSFDRYGTKSFFISREIYWGLKGAEWGKEELKCL